jgi:hypothetical protein
MNPLDQLKDLHHPAAPGWWPPAPGWWLLVLAALIIAGTLIALSLSKRRANRYRRLALAELATVSNRDNPVPELLAPVRRTAKTACPQSPWPALPAVELLSRMGATRYGVDPEKIAACLYAPASDRPAQTDVDQAVAMVRAWIRKHKRGQLC